MPRYSPGFTDQGSSRYGREFGDSGSGFAATSHEFQDSGFGGGGRGRGARKFANNDRFNSGAPGDNGYGAVCGGSSFGNENRSAATFEGGGGGARFGSGAKRDGNREVISLGAEMIPRLIGKGGSNIKRVETENGCKIQILKETKTDLKTDIAITGNEAGINGVKIYLEDEFGFSLSADRSMQTESASNNDSSNQFGQFSSGFGSSEGYGCGNKRQQNSSSWNAEPETSGGFGFGNWNEHNSAAPEKSSGFATNNSAGFGDAKGTRSDSRNSRGFGTERSSSRGFGNNSGGFGTNSGGFGNNSGSSGREFFSNHPRNFGDGSNRGFTGNSRGFGDQSRSSGGFGGNSNGPGGFANNSTGFNSFSTTSQEFGDSQSNGFSNTNSGSFQGNSFDGNQRGSQRGGFGSNRPSRNDEDFSVFSSKGNSGSRNSFANNSVKEDMPRFDWGPKGPPTAEAFAASVKGYDESSVPKIDWDAVRSCKPEARFKDYPAITKKFYRESPTVANRSEEEVKRIRDSKNNIIVKDMSKSGTRKSPNPVTTFEEAFEQFPEILDTIYHQGFTEPSPIQCQGWPVLLNGDDLIGIAQTGSGKTLAFLLPALIHIDLQPVPRDQRGGPNVLVLCPTRELALQIETEVKKYFYRGIKSVCVYGGGDRAKQVSICTEGVEIVIATPGRLYDLISNGIISIMSVTFVVLDEADRMLDLGFEPQILKCMLDVRPDRQTVMTSATWNWDVQRIAAKYLTDPFFVNVGSLDLTAVHSVTQKIVFAEEDDKEQLLYEMIREMQGDDKMIVFIGKKIVVDQIASKMALANMPAESIHGGRDQYSREEAIESFRENEVKVLLATDVASRGLDIVDVTMVVNYDFPRNMEEYVHRVGRTGRAGRTGTAVSFISRRDWGNAKELIRILEEADQEVPDQLRDMANRFDRRQTRMQAEGGFRRGGGGRGGGGGFGGGRGGRGGRRDRDEDDLFLFSASGFMPG